jgi:hypothetical protein
VQLLGRAVDVHTTTWLALGLLLAAGAIALSTLVVFRRTAQRRGLLIMTWAADGGQTFVVQDHSVRYRYTTTPPVGRSRRERHQRTESTSRLPRALSSVEDKDRDAG